MKKKVIYVRECDRCCLDKEDDGEYDYIVGQGEDPARYGFREVVVNEKLLLNEIVDIILRYGTSREYFHHDPDNAEDWPEWLEDVIVPVFERLDAIKVQEQAEEVVAVEDGIRQAQEFLRGQEGGDARC